MNWIRTSPYIEAQTLTFKYKCNVALFDLDGTLINVKSKSKFSKDESDFKFFSENIINKLKQLVNNNYCIIIITNQKGISKNNPNIEVWKKKIENINNILQIPFKLFSSIADDKYRKPNKTFYDMILECLGKDKLEIKDSFYCGDAFSDKCFNDTDYKFALNCKITFLTPNEFFLEKTDTKNVTYTNFPEQTSSDKIMESIKEKDPILIIMVGFPASGKTSFVKDNLEPMGFIRINMDTLKTPKKCLSVCEESMKQKKNVVIDNTNPDVDTRKKYLDLAKKYKYESKALIMTSNKDLSIHNMHYRSLKLDLKPIPALVYNIYTKKYVKPTCEEGFKEIHEINMMYPNDTNYFLYLY